MENKQLQEKTERIDKNNEAAEVIHEFKNIVRSKNRNIRLGF